MTKHMRVTQELHGEKFFVRQPDPVTGKMVRWATPLFLALVIINIADLIFAVDSVPAIFAITTDTFIVYTANIMAMACSAVVVELPKGVFITTMPCFVAAGKSTLSTPMPARPITFILVAAAINSGVAVVEERMARPSY
jgi:hypothetical protein